MAAPDTHSPPLPDLVQDCVHCGFCLPTCPTYVLWGEEMDSPRGRIVLIGEGLANGADDELSDQLVGHLDNCLGCMACVTACPSGVKYDQLLTRARPQVERRFKRPRAERLFRRAIFETFPHPGRLRALIPGAVVARKLRLDRLPLPGMLGAMTSLTPDVPLKATVHRLAEVTEAKGTKRGTVALLQGCVQRAFFGDVNEATVEVLAAEGFEVHAPRQPRCCGSLMLHTGYEDEARARAKDTIARLEGYEIVLTNAAGCGSGMKDYAHLLDDEPEWAERAKAFTAKVRDVLEFLGDTDSQAPRGSIALDSVVYHDACHLAHAQGIRAQPRDLLKSIPGLDVLDPPETELCCGSAGIYNLVRPEAAAELGRRKDGNLRSTGAQAVAAANPGCALQIAASGPAGAEPLRVHHPIELLRESLRSASTSSSR